MRFLETMPPSQPFHAPYGLREHRVDFDSYARSAYDHHNQKLKSFLFAFFKYITNQSSSSYTEQLVLFYSEQRYVYGQEFAVLASKHMLRQVYDEMSSFLESRSFSIAEQSMFKRKLRIALARGWRFLDTFEDIKSNDLAAPSTDTATSEESFEFLHESPPIVQSAIHALELPLPFRAMEFLRETGDLEIHRFATASTGFFPGIIDSALLEGTASVESFNDLTFNDDFLRTSLVVSAFAAFGIVAGSVPILIAGVLFGSILGVGSGMYDRYKLKHHE